MLQLEAIDGLSMIHISGTKGKGSTCAFCESILRAHGYKTGFFRYQATTHFTTLPTPTM
jgi:folylpolyglutamate synthase